jgi:hypothetical protein
MFHTIDFKTSLERGSRLYDWRFDMTTLYHTLKVF